MTRRLAARNPPRPPVRSHPEGPTVTLESVIAAHVEAIVTEVRQATPTPLLTDVQRDFSGQDVLWHEKTGDHYAGHILLPVDFMRLTVLRMSDWSMPVTSVIDQQSPLYTASHSRYAGIAGSPQRPRAAIVNLPEGRAIEFFSCLTDRAHICEAAYIPAPRLDRTEGIDISRHCINPVISKLAKILYNYE